MELLPVCYLFAVNGLAFVLFGADKRRARQHRRRIPERTLFLSALLGGSFGAILGMYTFRHKTLHKRFRYGLPAILLAQLALAGLWLAAASEHFSLLWEHFYLERTVIPL